MDYGNMHYGYKTEPILRSKIRKILGERIYEEDYLPRMAGISRLKDRNLLSFGNFMKKMRENGNVSDKIYFPDQMNSEEEDDEKYLMELPKFEGGRRSLLETYNCMKMPELKKMAKSKGLKRYSKLKKKELINLLLSEKNVKKSKPKPKTKPKPLPKTLKLKNKNMANKIISGEIETLTKGGDVYEPFVPDECEPKMKIGKMSQLASILIRELGITRREAYNYIKSFYSM